MPLFCFIYYLGFWFQFCPLFKTKTGGLDAPSPEILKSPLNIPTSKVSVKKKMWDRPELYKQAMSN